MKTEEMFERSHREDIGKYKGEKLTAAELASLEATRSMLPKPEYARGEEKLKYSGVFSTGEVLEASEDQEGIASITIKKGDSVVVDFSDFLPPHYKFAAPSHLKERVYVEEEMRGNWGHDSENKLILVRPKSFFSFDFNLFVAQRFKNIWVDRMGDICKIFMPKIF